MTNVPNGPAGEAMSDPRSILGDYHAAMTARIAVDPMLVLIRAYEAERERFNASDDPGDERAARAMENGTGGLEEPLVDAALAFIRTGRA